MAHYEHVFDTAMTSQGRPYSQFQRALATGNPLIACAAAAGLPELVLADQLALLLVLLSEPERYRRAAARWQANLCLELRTLTLTDVQLLVAALSALPGDGESEALATLVGFATRYKRADLVRVLERFRAGEFRRRGS
jgi:hypothetical protein